MTDLLCSRWPSPRLKKAERGIAESVPLRSRENTVVLTPFSPPLLLCIGVCFKMLSIPLAILAGVVKFEVKMDKKNVLLVGLLDSFVPVQMEAVLRRLPGPSPLPRKRRMCGLRLTAHVVGSSGDRIFVTSSFWCRMSTSAWED